MAKFYSNSWAEDVNKSDILQWIDSILTEIPPEGFGETRVDILVFPRRWGKDKCTENVMDVMKV